MEDNVLKVLGTVGDQGREKLLLGKLGWKFQAEDGNAALGRFQVAVQSISQSKTTGSLPQHECRNYL